MSGWLVDRHSNRTPSPERSYKHTKSPWTADRLKKKTKTSPAWKGLPDVQEAEESEDGSNLRSSMCSPQGSESLNHFRNSTEHFAACSVPSAAQNCFHAASPHTSSPFAKSTFQPQPLVEANHSSNISASWPNLLQKELSEENLLQTSLSSDCLYPYHNEATAFPLFPVSKPQRCSSPQLAKLQQEAMLGSAISQHAAIDENRQPMAAAFNVAHSLPASLTDAVRQQARTRIPRVRVVRRAPQQACTQAASPSNDHQRLHSSMSTASLTAGPGTALQVSWPLPAAMTSVALTDIAAVGLTSTAGRTQSVLQQPEVGLTRISMTAGVQSGLVVDVNMSQDCLEDVPCLSTRSQGDMMGSHPRFAVATDQGSLAPIVCDSPAVMPSQRPRVQFAQNVPHDSATSLIRLDAGMLPSPLTNRTVSAELVSCTPLYLACLAGNDHSHGPHVVPMIISPDDHHMHGLKGVGCQQPPEEEEEFVLHSIALSSPSAESESAFDESSPLPASPGSPCDRSILPNSAPGFVLSPFPQPLPSMLYSSSKAEAAYALNDDAPDSAQQMVALSHEFTHVAYQEADNEGAEEAVPAEVDDVDALNSLLKHWCKIGSDPKDAEEFVEEACKDGRILPNASTVNNLNKLWDTHDQLHV